MNCTLDSPQVSVNVTVVRMNLLQAPLSHTRQENCNLLGKGRDYEVPTLECVTNQTVIRGVERIPKHETESHFSVILYTNKSVEVSHSLVSHSVMYIFPQLEPAIQIF